MPEKKKDVVARAATLEAQLTHSRAQTKFLAQRLAEIDRQLALHRRRVQRVTPAIFGGVRVMFTDGRMGWYSNRPDGYPYLVTERAEVGRIVEAEVDGRKKRGVVVAVEPIATGSQIVRVLLGRERHTDDRRIARPAIGPR